MRIAIDLTSIPSELTGIGIYAQNLITNLVAIDRQNEYFVFVGRVNFARFYRRLPNFRFIAIKNRPKALRLLWEQFILPVYLAWHKVELLHSPHYTTPLLIVWVRRVVTFPDATFLLFPEKHLKYKVLFFRVMMKISAMVADAIISISCSTTDDLVKSLSVNRRKIKTIHLAATKNYAPIAERERIFLELKNMGLSSKYILFIGTIEPRKNVLGLAKAYFLLNTKIRRQYRLVIAGKKGWHYEELFSFVSSQNGGSEVIFTGYVEEKSLPLILNGASLFVYPSFYEGFGLPVLEAMACGVPVITSNISSMPEIAGTAAKLIDPHDVISIKSAIEEILLSDVLRREMIIKGIEQANKFSWEKCARETIACYEQLVKRGKNSYNIAS